MVVKFSCQASEISAADNESAFSLITLYAAQNRDILAISQENSAYNVSYALYIYGVMQRRKAYQVCENNLHGMVKNTSLLTLNPCFT